MIQLCRWAKGPRDEGGTAAVEFVVGLSMVVAVMLIVAQVAIATYVANVSIAAAYEGARLGGAVDKGPADALLRARSALSGAAGGYAREMKVSAAKVNDQIVVAVDGQIDPIIPGLPPIPVHARAAVYDEEQALK